MFCSNGLACFDITYNANGIKLINKYNYYTNKVVDYFRKIPVLKWDDLN